MTFSFRPAKRENVQLLIGLAGASGSGKTYTAMRLATGIAGDKPFCVIDTEAGRAKHYADRFRFDHGDLAAPFSPARYAEAIAAADAGGYPAIIVDSFSHEWAGEGGVLDMQEDEFKRMGYKDQAKMASWIRPKMEHKIMVQKLLQTRAHLIICLRAEEKIDMVKGEDGKMKVVPKVGPAGFTGWIPICEKNLPYEFTASFLLMAGKPGIPNEIKLQEQHRALFPLDRPITEESGRRIAEWAAGGKDPRDSSPGKGDAPAGAPSGEHPEKSRAGQNPTANPITMSQALDLETLCHDNKIPVEKLMEKANVQRLQDIPAAEHARALQWIDKMASRKNEAA
jgi:hypothetical protein